MKTSILLYLTIISLTLINCQKNTTTPQEDVGSSIETSSLQHSINPIVDPVQQYIIYVRPETHTLFFVDADYIPVWGQKVPALVIDFDHAASSPGTVVFENREVEASQLRLLLESDMQGLKHMLDNHGQIAYRFIPQF